MKSFAARAFRVAVDETGLVSATPNVDPGRPALLGLTIGPLTRDGAPVAFDLESVLVDDDEVVQRWSADGLAAVEVRHGFVGGWRTRLVLAELSGDAWTASFAVALEPGPGYRAWGLGTGTDAVAALLPESGASPILAVRSATSAAAVTADRQLGGIAVGPYRLAGGVRLVTTWEWFGVRWPRRLAAELASAWPVLPRSTVAAVEEEIWLPADPDRALVVPPGVAVDTLDDGLALTAPEPGRHRIELRSARGSTALDLAWAPPVADFLAATGERILAVPTGRAGVVTLPDLAGALVVQRVARTGGFPAAAAAADALDQFTARLVDPGADEAAAAALYLAGEYDRLGDPDLIDRALAAAGRPDVPVPGLGLAAVRTALAAMLAGVTAPPRPPLPASDRPLTPAGLELLLATRPPDELAADDRVTDALYRLALGLEAGLPGRSSADADLDQMSYALAVLRLVPDPLGSWWHQRFGGTVAGFVELGSLGLVDRLAAAARAGGPVTAAYGWLAVGS